MPGAECERGERPGDAAERSAREFCGALRLQMSAIQRGLGAQGVPRAKREAFAAVILDAVNAADASFCSWSSPDLTPRKEGIFGQFLDPWSSLDMQSEDRAGVAKPSLQRTSHVIFDGEDLQLPTSERCSEAQQIEAELSTATDDHQPDHVADVKSSGQQPEVRLEGNQRGQDGGVFAGTFSESTLVKNSLMVKNRSGQQSAAPNMFDGIDVEERRRQRLARRNSALGEDSFETCDSSAGIGSKPQLKRTSIMRSMATQLRSHRCLQVATSWQFEIFVLVSVLTNSIWIGIELELDDGLAVVSYVGITFMAIFFFELLVRIGAHGAGFFFGKECLWNAFDLILVLLSVIEVILNIVLTSGSEGGGSTPGAAVLNLRVLRIMRITRLVRVIRIARILRFVHALRALVYSITCTLKSLVWSLVLLLMIIYVFAIVFTVGVGDALLDSPEAKAEAVAAVETHWASLPLSMFTLWASITGGLSWQIAVLPLHQLNLAWVGLFSTYIAFVMFAVLNVMTGVFCQSAIESAAHDKDMAAQGKLDDKDHFVKNARLLFEEISPDGGSTLDYETVEAKFQEPSVRQWLDALDINFNDAWTFFKLINSGTEHRINIEQFVMGCLRLKGPARSIDIMQLMYEQRWLMDKFLLISSQLVKNQAAT